MTGLLSGSCGVKELGGAGCGTSNQASKRTCGQVMLTTHRVTTELTQYNSHLVVYEVVTIHEPC